jgi:hypothetical protein
MAYGNIVDYEPGPAPGSFNFTKADGSKMLFAGPAAEDLKAKLEASKKIGPQPTAQNMSIAPPRNVADVGPNMSAAPPPGPPPSGKNWAGMFNAPAPQPQGFGPAPQGGQPPPQGRPQGPGAVGLGYGLRVNGDGVIEQYHSAQAGSKGGPVEKGRTVAGGFDPDKEYVEGKENAYLAEQAGLATGMEAAQERAAEERGFLEEHQRQLVAREAEARAQKESIDRGVMDLEQKHEAARKEYSGSKVNPNKIFGGGRNWIMGLTAGLGGFAAALTGKQNSVIPIIESRIAQNIAAQERAIAIKGESADNALADLQRKLGSRELASKALADIQLDQFKAEMQKKSLTSDKELQGKYLALSAAAEGKQLDMREQYRQAALGQVTKSIVNAPATGGRAAGWGAVKDQLGTAKDLKTLNKVDEGAGGPAAAKKPAEQVRYEQSLEASARTLSDFVAEHGGSIDPVTGEITGDVNLPTDLPGADTQSTAAAKSRLTGLGSVYANMLNSGAEAGQPTKEAVTPQLGVTGSPQGQLQAMAREIAMRRQQAGLK